MSTLPSRSPVRFRRLRASHRESFLLVLCLIALGLFASGATIRAQSVTYTFEQFGFTVPSTPLVNVAPDSGPSSFRANFTSAPNATAFQVVPFQPNGLFSGNSLAEPTGTTGNVLTVTLNTAVNLVNLVFATNGPGSLTFASAAGTITVTSTPQSGGAGFQGGILSFSSATAFTSFTLTAGTGPEFAIDNLTMRIAAPAGVPDGGSTLAMIGGCALLLLAAHRRPTQRHAALT